MLRYCADLKAIRYELTTLNRIVADKSHRVIIALSWVTQCDLSDRFFCIHARSLCELQSDKLQVYMYLKKHGTSKHTWVLIAL